jgi:hypothetical protein
MDKSTVQRNYKLAALLLLFVTAIFVISMVLTYVSTHALLP